MAAEKCEQSRCGLCRFYRHEGRRGGICSQLNVPVNAYLASCCLAVSPFRSESNCEPESIAGIAKQEASKFVSSDSAILAKASAKVSIVSAA